MYRVVIALLLLSGSAGAQSMHPFADREAELTAAPAAPWMKEGLRLVFETGSASTPYRNERGELVAPAGSGLTTIDIVSLLGNDVGINMRNLVGANSGQPYGPPTGGGAVLKAGWGGEYWVAPDVLQATFAALQPGSGWQGAQGQMEQDGKQYQVMSFTYGGGDRDLSESRLVYEVKTGILISASTRSRSTVKDPWHLTTYTKFVSMRQVALPWNEGRPPSWLARIASYTFSGSQVLELPGVPPTSLPLEIELVRTQIGANYVVLEARAPGAAAAPDGQTNTLTVSGPSMFGGIWIPPLALEELRPGQVIDEDPNTRERITVQAVGRAPYGRNVVTFLIEAQGYATWMDYEIGTGMLLVMTVKDRLQNTSTQLRFTGKRRG